ncbi:MAG: DUF86 domain-containing protein [Bacteroidales bacterium]|nr:DUF86 domain-containing protein [Bacteroidales bacterium]
MREPVRDRERLEHIIEAIDRVLKYSAGKTKIELTSDSMGFFGVVKNIEIVGEASYKLSKRFRQLHPDTPWDDITRMRHVLIHDYYQIDEDAVFYVIEDNLKPLRQQVARYLTETDWDEWEKNAVVINETAVHKNLIQTAERMKKRGYDTDEICKITGLNRDEIENL